MKKIYDKPRQNIENRDITLLTNVHLVKVIVFPVVMYGCELDKKAECQRIDVFELWHWRRHLRVPWIAKSPKKRSPKEINHKYSLED